MSRRAPADAGGAGPSAMLRSQHAEATRRAVLAAARSLFGRNGYAQTSVDEIADAARVTKGAVYHHFAGKEALFRAVHAEVESEAQARAVAAGDPQAPPIDQIIAKVNAERLQTRLGPLACRASGQGPALVFFAGAFANGDLWRDVVAALEDRYRCITIDLPLGAHPWPLVPGADRSATSLARLLPDCLDLLDVHDATVVANDTAGGLLLLSLASGHPALARVGRLVLTNCESYDQFPPDKLKKAAAMCRMLPGLSRSLIRLQLRSPAGRRRVTATVAARALDDDRAESFFGPASRDPQVAGDLVAAQGGFRPELLLDAAKEIPRFGRPVLLIWGDACGFFPMSGAQRLASEFPSATLVPVPGARTWVPVDNPDAVAEAIIAFVPTPVP